jgi:hypothetical protein
MTSLRSRWRPRAPLGHVAHRSEPVSWPTPIGSQTLYGVPTFKALQGICVKYLIEHQCTPNEDLSHICSCRVALATYDDWLAHVTELQASHLAMAIQEARNTP